MHNNVPLSMYYMEQLFINAYSSNIDFKVLCLRILMNKLLTYLLTLPSFPIDSGLVWIRSCGCGFEHPTLSSTLSSTFPAI